jgi:hypothetical protein
MVIAVDGCSRRFRFPSFFFVPSSINVIALPPLNRANDGGTYDAL